MWVRTTGLTGRPFGAVILRGDDDRVTNGSVFHVAAAAPADGGGMLAAVANPAAIRNRS